LAAQNRRQRARNSDLATDRVDAGAVIPGDRVHHAGGASDPPDRQRDTAFGRGRVHRRDRGQRTAGPAVSGTATRLDAAPADRAGRTEKPVFAPYVTSIENSAYRIARRRRTTGRWNYRSIGCGAARNRRDTAPQQCRIAASDRGLAQL